MRNLLRLFTLLAACSLPLVACVETDEASRDSEDKTDSDTGIIVSGRGEATGTPDVLDVDIGVSVLRPTVADAVTEATRLAGALRDTLVSKGIARTDLQTSAYTIAPEYDQSPDGKGSRHIVGYRATNVLRARLRDIPHAGDVLDAATKAGGNDVVIRGLSFTIEDRDELVSLARKDAWEDARAKAKELAALSGVALGGPIAINESVGPTPAFGRFGTAAADIVTPIEPGELKVTVSVTVRFTIEDSLRGVTF